MKKQAYNPFLPLDVCIPDGEPHVFGDRVYLFGSHEEDGGDKFCTLGYEFYSAPIDDLSDWSSKGINYMPQDDPSYGETYKYMYAPDVVQGNDGKYYLYYAMSGGCFTGPIHVAVCDTPDGKYRYYGEVKNADGSVFTRKITFDPAVINDNGIVRLYYGWSLAVEKEKIPKDKNDAAFRNKLIDVQSWMFSKSREEIEREGGIMGAFTVELGSDMFTVKTSPKLIAPGQFDSIGTTYKGHAFFEGSSIRKLGDTYYFIFSSENQHELCYATSKYPDKDFTYRGTIISNGDIGFKGRTAANRVCATGNNHGSIENINGQWYVFYHRQTHKTSFSRKACAEKISIAANGNIAQVQMTSCGLNGGALKASGEYPAVICTELTNGSMPHLDPQSAELAIPYITNCGKEQYIADITNGVTIGYKYFLFVGSTEIIVKIRGDAGVLQIIVGDCIYENAIEPSQDWCENSFSVTAEGRKELYIRYNGNGKIDCKEIAFI